MKPLVEITEAIGAEQWVTISTLRPLLHKLLHVHLVGKSTNSKIESALKNTMRSDLQNRYVDDALVFLTKAAFLDPRFRMLGFLDSSEREDVISRLKEEAITLAESVIVQDESDDVPQTSRGIQRTKGGTQVNGTSRRCSSGEHRRSTLNYYTFSKSQFRNQQI